MKLAPKGACVRCQGGDRAATVQAQGAAIGPAGDLLDTGNGALREERDQRLAVERLADGKPQLDAPRRGGVAAPARAAAQLARRPAVDRAQRVVELPDAAEARAHRDLGEGKLRALDQVPGGLRPLRARKRDRAGPELRDEDPVELPLREVKPPGKPADALAIHGAVGDQPHCPAGHSGAPVPVRGARDRVRVAALAGAEPLLLRGRDAPEQPDVAAVGQPRRAARPAVDAGRLHGHHEEAVVARIAALHEAVAALEVVDHTTIVARALAVFGHAGRGTSRRL